MNIVGISAYYHDSAAVLLRDGKIAAAAQEERFSRSKHDARFPGMALRYCLDEANIGPQDVDHVVFYDKPFLKFERLVETYLSFAPRGFASFRKAMPLWIGEKLFMKSMLAKELSAFGAQVDWASKLLFSEHHLSHAASAFYPSPFDEAAILTLDGVGEWATSSIAIGSGRTVQVLKEIHFPHSVGLLYSAFTYHLGFRVNSGEYKVMGLAPYGRPVFKETILTQLLDVKPDGSFRMDMNYFDYCVGLRMTNARFAELFGVEARKPEEPLRQAHLDLAASIQAATEEIVLRLGRAIAASTGQKNLCLAGGVALNCVANGALLRDGCFDHIWIQPAAGDAGGALGAAMLAHYEYLKHERPKVSGRDLMQGALLGPAYSQDEIETALLKCGAKFEVLTERDLIETAAQYLADGKALGWFQGRMEFGPRALGARSILADARSPTMQSVLNLKIKYRESFRPFAPSVLEEDAADWFELKARSPYMLIVAEVRADKRVALDKDEADIQGLDAQRVTRSLIPAVTHVDYSARIQTVECDVQPRYHALLSEFKALTGCPVVVNTSFNVRGEPIAAKPEDAFRCFMGTEIDGLAIGNCFLRKEDQDPALKLEYKGAFELD